MKFSTFLSLTNEQIAAQLQDAESTCWAIALGGTRRAYLAQGGTLVGRDDVLTYFQWIEKAQRKVFDQLYDLGIETIIAVVRVPIDRGPVYHRYFRQTMQQVLGAARQRWYQQRQLRVYASGDLATLGKNLDMTSLHMDFQELAQRTAKMTGPRLTYLFRGYWTDITTEEAHLGYQLGTQLGRAPTQVELIQAFYGEEIPKLAVYVGSGRPRMDVFRPPFISGSEDCYWCATSPVRLLLDDWRKIIYDHLYLRKTKGNREYTLDKSSCEDLTSAVQSLDSYVLGVGQKHSLGFWMPDTRVEIVNYSLGENYA